MSLSSLQALADNREALLLAEVAALLHDVGKLSSQFIDQMSHEPSARSDGFAHENAVEKIEGFVDKRFLDVFKQAALRDQLRWDWIPKNEQIGQVLDLILHHDKAKHSALLVRLLNLCDGLDSGADKGTTRVEGLPKEAKQAFDSTYLATAFGTESKLDPQTLDTTRQKSTATIGNMLGGSDANAIASRYPEILNAIKEMYANGLAETRRSANDVSLWDHSFSVATLYKSSLATFFLKGRFDIDHLRWRLLCVNFDVLGLYAKAIKIADLLGYQHAVEQACKKIKQLVEVEYPLGNEVYRDTTGIYFTFPDLDLPADLEQEIRRRIKDVEPELAPRIAVKELQGNTAAEQLKRLLAEAHKEARQELAQPFDMQNLNLYWQQMWNTIGNGKWELCPVCRLRPKEESQEACETCERRRGSRIADWEKNPAQTIWMDELADHNDRVALLVGKFGLDDWLSGDLVQTMLVRADPQKNKFTPKNPSPARLRRIWETCQRFWTETVEQQILAQYPYGKETKNAELRRVRWLVIPAKKNGWQENVPYDGTVNGKPISLLWRDNAKYFVTIINLQLTGELKHGQKITVSDPDEPRKKITFEVEGVIRETDRMGSYTPFLSLLSSPDQFLALVPAADALNVAEKIRGEYVRQFGKVQNRLPLFLGIVFFHRKIPLMAAMDTARRMLAVPVSGEQWIVKQFTNGTLTFRSGVEWTVPTTMGDGSEDKWYPYFQVEQFADGTPDNRAYRFQHDGRWFVHVNELKEGDVVYVIPSRFAYLWLEQSAQRFQFDAHKDVMLLDELPRVMEMWKKLCQTPEMTDTKLRGVQALLEAKGAEWGGTSDEFQNLARTTLGRAKMLDAVALEDVTSGRFARCLELYTKILKRKVKED